MSKEKLRFRRYIGKPFYICVLTSYKYTSLDDFELLDILKGKYLGNIKPFNKLKINIHRQEYLKLIEHYTQKTINEMGEITDYNMRLPTIEKDCFKGCGRFLSCSTGNNNLSKNYNWWEIYVEVNIDKVVKYSKKYDKRLLNWKQILHKSLERRKNEKRKKN